MTVARKKLGTIDCLINNAALFEKDDIANFTTKSWNEHLNTNLLAPAILIKQFSDRQINIPPSSIEYILTRITRSLSAVSIFVTALDNLMLKTKKRPNRSLISEVLDKIIKDEA